MTASKAAGNVAKLRDIVDISDPVYGAALDGVTDDRAALLAAVATGKIVSLGGKTLAIGSQVAWTADGGGIVGPGSIVMLTSAGKFVNTANANKFDANSCALYVNGFDGVRFENFKISLGGAPAEANEGIAIGVCDSLRSRISGV